MRFLLFPALIVAAASGPAAAQAHDSGAVGYHAGAPTSQAVLSNRTKPRWMGSAHTPGGWPAYRRPSRGYILPHYWVHPRFAVRNWSVYGLYRPRAGYGWQRYYDDAVLIDRYGRVVDYVPNHHWAPSSRQLNYDDGYGYRAMETPQRRAGSTGGALIGGAFGAIAGSAIAGRGNRTQGAILGGGLGAIAGAVIGGRDGRQQSNRPRLEDRQSDVRDDTGRWRGRWEGRWVPEAGRDGPVYEGQYEGTYEDVTRWDNDEIDYQVMQSEAGAPVYGYGSHGPYAAPGVTTIVIHSEPVVTTHTTTEYITEVVRAPVRQVARKAAPVKKAKRPTCVCKLVYR